MSVLQVFCLKFPHKNSTFTALFESSNHMECVKTGAYEETGARFLFSGSDLNSSTTRLQNSRWTPLEVSRSIKSDICNSAVSSNDIWISFVC